MHCPVEAGSRSALATRMRWALVAPTAYGGIARNRVMVVRRPTSFRKRRRSRISLRMRGGDLVLLGRKRGRQLLERIWRFADSTSR